MNSGGVISNCSVRLTAEKSFAVNFMHHENIDMAKWGQSYFGVALVFLRLQFLTFYSYFFDKKNIICTENLKNVLPNPYR